MTDAELEALAERVAERVARLLEVRPTRRDREARERVRVQTDDQALRSMGLRKRGSR